MVIMPLLLSACYNEDTAYDAQVPSGWFRIDTWDGGYPAVIDPYVNDGVFDISWSLLHPDQALNVSIRLGVWPDPANGDIQLLRERCDDWHSSCNLSDHQAYQYTTRNELLRVDDTGYAGWLADLTGLSPYGRTFHVHFEACNDYGLCTRSSSPVILW